MNARPPVGAPADPIVLPPNQPRRFYRGGGRIADFRRLEAIDEWRPEDWVGSSTPLFGEQELGLTRLPSGELLRDAVAHDPAGWLGDAHVRRHGADPSLLVKLLDAGQRLPVHAHPTGRFAVDHHVSAGHGKNEAWYILRADAGAVVHLGFARPVAEAELAAWVRAQSAQEMLAATNRIPVAAGDAIFVPAGLPHAIGEGILLVEAQEPTDLSILMEWTGFALDGARDGHLGLGFDVALQAVDRQARGPADIECLVMRGPSRTGSLLPPAADDHFRIERHAGDASDLDAGYSVVVVAAGGGAMTWGDRGARPIEAGMTILTPHACGPIAVRGAADLIRCRPPA